MNIWKRATQRAMAGKQQGLFNLRPAYRDNHNKKRQLFIHFNSCASPFPSWFRHCQSVTNDVSDILNTIDSAFQSVCTLQSSYHIYITTWRICAYIACNLSITHRDCFSGLLNQWLQEKHDSGFPSKSTKGTSIIHVSLYFYTVVAFICACSQMICISVALSVRLSIRGWDKQEL